MAIPNPFFSLTDLGLEADANTLLTSWLQAMQAAFPGYNPSAGNLEYILAQILASWAVDEANLCSNGSTELFRQYGLQILQLPIELGGSASVTATIEAVDTVGYTLPAGTQVQLILGGAAVGFQTADSLTIPAGSSSGSVTLFAVQTGSLFNGSGAPAQLITPLTWVSSITIVGTAQGGTDQESDADYLNRLVAQLQLLAPRPITASDYAVMARSFVPAIGTDQDQVGLATAIDGYDPTTNTYQNEREVTVAVADSNGEPLNSDTVTAVQTWLESLREVNFIVNVVDFNYSTVYVTVTVAGAANVLASTIQTNVQTSLMAYLSPANFGLGGTAVPNVYLSRLESLIQQVAGVDHVVPGTLAVDLVSPPGNTTADLVLPGPFPLAVSSTSSIPLSGITVI